MNDEEARELRGVIVAMLRWLGKLQASEAAFTKILAELLPHLSREQRAVVVRYPEYCEQLREAALLKLEEQFPALAAEIDSETPSPPPRGPGP